MVRWYPRTAISALLHFTLFYFTLLCKLKMHSLISWSVEKSTTVLSRMDVWHLRRDVMMGVMYCVCQACDNFIQDGKCVSQCPPEYIANPNTHILVPNPDFKYTYGIMCVDSCPGLLLLWHCWSVWNVLSQHLSFCLVDIFGPDMI